MENLQGVLKRLHFKRQKLGFVPRGSLIFKQPVRLCGGPGLGGGKCRGLSIAGCLNKRRKNEEVPCQMPSTLECLEFLISDYFKIHPGGIDNYAIFH